MKITKSQLRKIINEEIGAVLQETDKPWYKLSVGAAAKALAKEISDLGSNPRHPYVTRQTKQRGRSINTVTGASNYPPEYLILFQDKDKRDAAWELLSEQGDVSPDGDSIFFGSISKGTGKRRGKVLVKDMQSLGGYVGVESQRTHAIGVVDSRKILDI